MPARRLESATTSDPATRPSWVALADRTNRGRATWLVLRWNPAVRLQQLFGVSGGLRNAGNWKAAGWHPTGGRSNDALKGGSHVSCPPVGRYRRPSPFAGDHAGVPRRQSTAQQRTTLPRRSADSMRSLRSCVRPGRPSLREAALREIAGSWRRPPVVRTAQFGGPWRATRGERTRYRNRRRAGGPTSAIARLRLSEVSSPGGAGEAAALVLATQEFVANGGGRPSGRRRWSAHRPSGSCRSACAKRRSRSGICPGARRAAACRPHPCVAGLRASRPPMTGTAGRIPKECGPPRRGSVTASGQRSAGRPWDRAWESSRFWDSGLVAARAARG